MNFIGYAELTKGRNFPSMRESLESVPYPNKNAVIQYLQSGEIQLARASRARDVFSGEFIPAEVLVMSDGTFYWSNELAWYVERYNLRLPKDFEQHILQKQ